MRRRPTTGKAGDRTMSRFFRIWYRVSSTFWFIPALIVAGATVLAVLAVEADARYVAAGALETWPRMFGAGASASRSLLAAVAGSMITVAGTVFSITLVALSLASSQYSSRVLRNFIRDRTNQSVLGVFIGIFAYCLVVLRSIHGDGDDAFVPSVAVFLGLLLGFGGIGVLVFFIHHIAQSVQASRIVEAIRLETAGAIERLFPRRLAGVEPPASIDSDWHEAWRADATGYVQFVDHAQLRDAARAQGIRLKVSARIGQFVMQGHCLLSASPATPDGFGDTVSNCWSIGAQRTLEQDIGFGIRQLVDVALKALSPGLNDTTTAVMCIDAVAAVMVQLAPRDLRFDGCDGDGVVRVQADHSDFCELLGESLDQIRYAASDNAAVLERLHWALSALSPVTSAGSRRQALERQALRLGEAIERRVADPADRDRLAAAVESLIAELAP